MADLLPYRQQKGKTLDGDLLTTWQTTPKKDGDTLAGMAKGRVPQIRKGSRGHLYLDQWFEYRGVNDEKVAGRLNVDRTTIWKWRKEPHRLDPDKIDALAHALNCTARDLWGPPPNPERPSLDAIMNGAPDEAVREAAEMLAILRRARG